jgi:site-specific DNA-methyltransferase (adenine-specific)
VIRLLEGDCLARMAKLPAESVDMVFVDPPYNLSNGGASCHNGRRVRVDKGDWDKSGGFTADVAFHTQWLQGCRRLLKPNGTIWISGTLHSIYICGYLLRVLGFHLLNDISWYKPNASPNLACRTFTHSHETLLWARRERDSRHLFNYREMKHSDFAGDLLKAPGKQMRSVWRIPAAPQSEKTFGKHPTQKPVALLERVILASTSPGALVFDPFMGSGTTGVVCLRHGRNFIGIENDANYLRLAAQRMGRQHDRPARLRVA